MNDHNPVLAALDAREKGREEAKTAADQKRRDDAPQRECQAALWALASIDPERPDWWKNDYPKLLFRAAKKYRDWKGDSGLPGDASLERPDFTVARVLMIKALNGAGIRTLMIDCAAITDTCVTRRDRECFQGLLLFPQALLDALRSESAGSPAGLDSRAAPASSAKSASATDGVRVEDASALCHSRDDVAKEVTTGRSPKRRRYRSAPKPGWIYVADAVEKYDIPRTTMERYRSELKKTDRKQDAASGMWRVKVKALEVVLRKRCRWPK